MRHQVDPKHALARVLLVLQVREDAQEHRVLRVNFRHYFRQQREVSLRMRLRVRVRVRVLRVGRVGVGRCLAIAAVACSRKRAVKFFGWVFFLISSGSPHVRPMGRTCGEPDEIGLTAMGVELNGS